MKSKFVQSIGAIVFVLIAFLSKAQTVGSDSLGIKGSSPDSSGVYYISIGDTIQLQNPIMAPGTVYWNSSNPKIVSVFQDGNIIGESEGFVTIYITNANNNTVMKWPVKVHKPSNDTDIYVQPEPPVNPYYYKIKVGESINIKPDATISTPYSWVTSDKSIAIVDQNGTVNGIYPGQATIYINLDNGQPISKYLIYVTDTSKYIDSAIVIKPEPPIYPNEYNIKIGETINIQPDATIAIPYKWISTNDSIVKVDQKGNVTGIKNGMSTVYMSYADGSILSKYLFIVGEISKPIDTVIKPVTPVYPFDYNIKVGESINIKPNISITTPIVWSSNNTLIAKVDQNGIVTGLSMGQTTIYLGLTDGTIISKYMIFVYDTTKLIDTGIVVKPVPPINANDYKIKIGETINIKPEISFTTTLFWKSNNEQIASVDKDGNVTGHSIGEAIIYLSTAANSSALSKYIIHIVDPTFVNIPSVNTKYEKLKIGEKFTLQSDSGTTYFVSSDSSIKAMGKYEFVATKIGETKINEYSRLGALINQWIIYVYDINTTVPPDTGVVPSEKPYFKILYLSVGETANLNEYNPMSYPVSFDWLSNGVVEPGLNGSFKAIASGYANCTLYASDSGRKWQMHFAINVTSDKNIGKDSLMMLVNMPLISALNFQYQNYSAIEKIDSNVIRIIFDKEITNISEIEKSLNLSVQSQIASQLKAGVGSLTIKSVTIDPTNKKAIIITTEEVIPPTVNLSLSFNNIALLSTQGNAFNKVVAVENKLTETESLTANTVVLYPNIASGSLMISAKSISSIEIYSLDGVLIDRLIINASSQTIDVSNYRSGMYIVKIKTPDLQSITKRFIKQ